MTREEWYKHTTIDHVEAVAEYVQIMHDGAMETAMSSEVITQLRTLLMMLQYDISKQLKEYEND